MGACRHGSRPSRARGLKQALPIGSAPLRQVAPLAGAWIETTRSRWSGNRSYVAPLAGAWIETWFMGLLFLTPCVAPLAGAWIETA